MHTLHVEHVVLLALYTLLTITNSSQYKGMKGIHWFSLYNLFALLGSLAVALRGHIPDFTSIVVGNLFVVAGYLFLFLSLTDFFGRKPRQTYLHAALILIAVLTMLEYGWVHPNTAARLVALSLILACQQGLIAIDLYHKQVEALRVATSSMAIMMAIMMLTNFVRVFGVLLQGAPNDYLASGPFLAWIVIITSCLQGGAVVAYVWMTAAVLRRDLEVQASTDPLTGLLNRRAIELAADQRIAACKKANAPIAAIVLDLDGFKQINDSFGHRSGDATLIAVAGSLLRCMRKDDLLGRIGGDEFAIILPQTTIEAATEIAGRLRAALENTQIIPDQPHARVTTSFGIAQLQNSHSSWETLFLSCDKALYDMKRAGRETIPPRRDLNPRLSMLPG
jgi:diguanylate cyclase (GGDEF)-like protein